MTFMVIFFIGLMIYGAIGDNNARASAAQWDRDHDGGYGEYLAARRNWRDSNDY